MNFRRWPEKRHALRHDSGIKRLQIETTEDRLAEFEWIEEGKPFREWLVPAAILNQAGTIKNSETEDA